MADVTIKSTNTVKPAGEPWSGTVALGEWDQIVTSVYVSTIYFYAPNGEWEASGKSMVDTLKNSLAHALFHFYPQAGRIHRAPGGGSELRCEGQGVAVVEAESSCELSDFGDFSCFDRFCHLIPSLDMGRPVEELPLVNVQITRFGCGGMSLGLLCNHAVTDGLGSYHFLNEWARLARGEALLNPPVHDRTLLRAGEPPRGPRFASSNKEVARLPPPPMGAPTGMPPMKETKMIVLPLSKAQIDKLKSAANATHAGDERPFSRYEVLTAHIWRCVNKAKGSDGVSPRGVAITLDARPRVAPPLPTHYFGNAVLMVAATSPPTDLTTKPLGHVCGRIRETISKVTDEYIQTEIDDLKSLESLGVFRGIRDPVDTSFVLPEVGVISWLNLPVHGIDFGWGDHVYMGPGATGMEGVTNVLPGKEGDGSVLVVMCFGVECVDELKRCFYEGLV